MNREIIIGSRGSKLAMLYAQKAKEQIVKSADFRDEDIVIKKLEKQKSFLAKKLSSSLDNQIDNIVEKFEEKSLWQRFGL